MKFLINYKNLDKYLFLISIFTIILFFFGFYFQENSAGAGGLNGDFTHVWNNLALFKNNNFWTGLDSTAGLNEFKYKSNRPPLIYILNVYFNPFVSNKEDFFLSIFIFSFLTYILFFYSLRKIYSNSINNSLILLLSSIILLSPYFRTSSFWGLEENFGIFATIVSVIFFNKIKSEQNKNKTINIFFVVFFSSLCVYFDQKLVIITLYFYLSFLLSKKFSLQDKISSTILYFVFSIPFLYLIYIWGNIMPVHDAAVRGVLKMIYWKNLVYSLTIIAFYIFPFLFLKKESFFVDFKHKFKSFKIYFLFLLLALYLAFLAKIDPLEKEFLGNGIVYKFSILIFNNFDLSKIFLYLSFFGSISVIYLFIDDIRDYLFIIALILSSIFITPLFQEYYDPIIFMLILMFFFTKLSFNVPKIFFLYSYFFIFFIIANIHYKSQLFLFFK